MPGVPILLIVVAGVFAVREQFRYEYQRPVESGNDPERLKSLNRRIRHFILIKRLKEKVLRELPPLPQSDL